MGFAIRRSQASDIVAQPDLAGQRRVEPGLVGVERADARKILEIVASEETSLPVLPQGEPSAETSTKAADRNYLFGLDNDVTSEAARSS